MRLDGLRFVACQNAFLRGFGRAAFTRDEKWRADPRTGSAGCQHGGDAASGGNAAGRQDGFIRQVEDDLQQRQRADVAGMAAGFGALRDENVGAGVERRDAPRRGSAPSTRRRCRLL